MVFKLSISITAFSPGCSVEPRLSDGKHGFTSQLHSLSLPEYLPGMSFLPARLAVFFLFSYLLLDWQSTLYFLSFSVLAWKLYFLSVLSVLTLKFLTNVLHVKINCSLLSSWARWDLRELSCCSSHSLCIVQPHLKCSQIAIDMLSFFSTASAYFLMCRQISLPTIGS